MSSNSISYLESKDQELFPHVDVDNEIILSEINEKLEKTQQAQAESLHTGQLQFQFNFQSTSHHDHQSSQEENSLEETLHSSSHPNGPNGHEPQGRGQGRTAHTLFGFTIERGPGRGSRSCVCKVNNEVRLSIWILLVFALICFIAILIYASSSSIDQVQSYGHPISMIIGGVFALLAIILSIIQIKQHLNHWVHPPSQRCVVRILIMVPVYSVSAWLGLTFYQFALYIDFLRVCYEAFVIYTFMILLTKYLGGHEGVVESMEYKLPFEWPQPLCCLKPVIPSINFVKGIKYGTLQYAIVAPLVAFLALWLNLFDLYGDGELNGERGYLYLTLLVNCSQMVSLYSLVWLYLVLKNELAPFSPGYKFLAVKAVVFMTFWQSVGITILVHFSVVKETQDFQVGYVQVMLQDFIVCIEMFLAACAHKYVFGFEGYANGAMTLLMQQRAIRLSELTYKAARELHLTQQIVNHRNEVDDNNPNNGDMDLTSTSPNINSIGPVSPIVIDRLDDENEGMVLVDDSKLMDKQSFQYATTTPSTGAQTISMELLNQNHLASDANTI